MVQYLSSVLVYSSNNASFTLQQILLVNINEGVFFGQKFGFQKISLKMGSYLPMSDKKNQTLILQVTD